MYKIYILVLDNLISAEGLKATEGTIPRVVEEAFCMLLWITCAPARRTGTEF